MIVNCNVDLLAVQVIKKMLFQGASASFPAFYCNVSQSMLRNHASAEQEHNFKTIDCKLRGFGEMRNHLKDQISELMDDDVKCMPPEEFFKHAVDSDRNDYEREFRVRGKRHGSIIGRNNSCVDSMDFVIGGGLHNEIGLVNDCLKILFDGLDKEELDSIPGAIRSFLDSPRSDGGAGCSPGQYHGGQYNGRGCLFIFH